MVKNPVIESLNALIQLDYDAILCYDQAIAKIEHEKIRKQLVKFRSDHDNHVEVLTEMVRRYEGTPPTRSRDVMGVMLQGFTMLRSVTGTEGALSAMEMSEKLTNRAYETAPIQGVAPEVRKVLAEFLEEERLHLLYIQDALRDKPWLLV